MTGPIKSHEALESSGSRRIVLIGASVRPLIASCLSAGCVPIAFDFFADWDGQRLIRESQYANASLTKIHRYEDLLEVDFAKLGDAVILTGGAELRPGLVKAVSGQLSLFGPNAESLAAIADPINWLEVLRESGCRVPESRRELPKNTSAEWLVKQSGTCGGSGVRLLDSSFANQKVPTDAGGSYFQQRIPGQSWGTVLVSRRRPEDNISATFSLGCTRQWLAGEVNVESKRICGSGSHQTSGRSPDVPSILTNPAVSKSLAPQPPCTRPFAYRGSVGPLPVSKTVQLQIDQISSSLGRTYSMQGVWGMDFVLDSDDKVWPVDFNPRITASAELFETLIARSGSKFRSILDLHMSACRSTGANNVGDFEKLADDLALSSMAESCEAKRVVFFSGSDAIEINKAKWDRLSSLQVPKFFESDQTGTSVADLPRLGDFIEVGRPLLTLRSRSKTEAAAAALLSELFDAVKACVDGVV